MAAPITRLSHAIFQHICSNCQALSHPVLGVAAIRWNSNRATVAKTNRKKYTRVYPAMIVNQDGSTYWIKYPEPRFIMKLPVDISTLSAEERKLRLKRYAPKKKEVMIEDDLEDDDDFDSSKYKRMFQKTRR
ncbi:large ribosomal subunit protein mL55-like [Amphiura filiformis]|uniref:large ribosomal subunit protein mL55-like n=1 Tax=Amphiura filiformis TaxID=82378 RepID=UPI003B21EE7E